MICVTREKPIENRTWPTSYRGPLLIHAGKSRDWLVQGDEETFPDMAFGKIIGLVDLIDCVQVMHVPIKYPNLEGHIHANGPWCFILSNPREIEPIEFKGKQGFWNYLGEYVVKHGGRT